MEQQLRDEGLGVTPNCHARVTNFPAGQIPQPEPEPELQPEPTPAAPTPAPCPNERVSPDSDGWLAPPLTPPGSPTDRRTDPLESLPPPYEADPANPDGPSHHQHPAPPKHQQQFAAPPLPPPLPPAPPTPSPLSTVAAIKSSPKRDRGANPSPPASGHPQQQQQQQTPSPKHRPSRRQRMSHAFGRSAQRSLVVDAADLHLPTAATGDKPRNDKLSLITMLVDRSGSMASMGPEVAGGVNAYLDEQRKTDEEDGRATHVILSIFDDKYEVVRSAPLKEQPAVTDAEVCPRGMTALYDAVGHAIRDSVQQLETMAEVPGSVVVFILTDGDENSSKDWHNGTVKAQIKALEAVPHEWEFYFAAANQDALESGARIGITNESCLTFDASPAGMRVSMASASQSVTRMKRTPLSGTASRKSERHGSKSFTMEERTSSMRGSMDWSAF